MSARATAGILVGIGALAMFSAPDLAAFYRNEDFLDFDYYGRRSLLDCVLRPHLDSALVSFWRPSDAMTWCIVRASGPTPAHAFDVHAWLLLLHALAAAATMLASRSLFEIRPSAAIAAPVIVLLHPSAASVVLFLDGGAPQLLHGTLMMLALWALGRWRAGTLSAWPMVLLTLLAMLSFDTGLALPVLLCGAALLLPVAERRCPWSVLSLVPLVALCRVLVTGHVFRGYGAAFPSQEVIFEAPRVVMSGLAWLSTPSFALLHTATQRRACAGAAALLLLIGVLYTAFRGADSLRTMTRRLLAWLLLLAATFALGIPELVLQSGPSDATLCIKMYRLYPATLVLAMGIAWWIHGIGERWRFAPLLAVAPWGFMAWHLGAGMREAQSRAGERCLEIREQLVDSSRSAPTRPIVLLNTPETENRNGLPLAPVFQLGLSNGLRVPVHAAEIAVYPLFNVDPPDGDMFMIAHPLTIARLLQSKRFQVLRFDGSRVVPFTPPEVIDGQGTIGSLQIRPPQVAENWEPDGEVHEVVVSDQGEIEIGIRSEVAGILRLVAFNRLHPYFVQELPAHGLHLRREASGGPTDRLVAKAAHLLEIVRWFPGEIVWLVAQSTPDPARAAEPAGPRASNALPVRFTMQPSPR